MEKASKLKIKSIKFVPQDQVTTFAHQMIEDLFGHENGTVLLSNLSLLDDFLDIDIYEEYGNLKTEQEKKTYEHAIREALVRKIENTYKISMAKFEGDLYVVNVANFIESQIKQNSIES